MTHPRRTRRISCARCDARTVGLPVPAGWVVLAPSSMGRALCPEHADAERDARMRRVGTIRR